MAGKVDTTTEAGNRPKIDEGVVRRSAERSFNLWSDAPTATKDRYLLSGPTLSAIEGHMLAHPEDYSSAYRKFITASASHRAGETAVGRARFDDDERRKERRVRLMFFAAAGLALLHATSGQLKPALESMINGSEATKLAASRPRSPASPNVPPADLLASQSKVVMSTHRDPTTGEAVITTIAEPRPQKPVVVSDRDLKAERERQNRLLQRHAALANQRSEQGDKRVALHLAAEAFRQSETLASMPVQANESTGLSEALSALYRGLGSSSQALAAAARPMTGVKPLTCGGRYLLPSQDGAMRLVERATGAVQEVQFTAMESGRVGAVNATCTMAAVLAEDYTVKVVEFSKVMQRTTAVLHGHQSDILDVAFSPDGRLVATASLDASVLVWDARTGRRLASMAEHSGAVVGVRFSPDGRTLMSWGPDKTARLWAMPSGNSLVVLASHLAGVIDAQVSGDGRRILTTSLDGYARIFSAQSGALESMLQSERSSVALARFSPDDAQIALVTHEGDVEIWSAATASRASVRRDITEDPARDLAISPDGRWLIVTSWTGRVMLVATALKGDIVELNSEGQSALHAAIEADGRHVVAINANGTTNRWPLYSGHGEAAAEAIRIAGACLTAAERDELGIGASIPAWCKKAVTPAKP